MRWRCSIERAVLCSLEQSSIPPSPCNLNDLADDVPALLKGLGIATPVHAVIGVSQGGATTLALAHRHRSLASHYVVCDTQPTSPAANSKAWDERIALAQGKGMAELAAVTIPRWFAPGTPCAPGGRYSRWISQQVEQTDVLGFERGARALQGYDLAPGLAEALQGKHVLFVAGSNDGKLPEVLENAAKTIAEAGTAASVKYAVVPGGGHLPMCDQPTAWITTVMPFLEV